MMTSPKRRLALEIEEKEQNNIEMMNLSQNIVKDVLKNLINKVDTVVKKNHIDCRENINHVIDVKTIKRRKSINSLKKYDNHKHPAISNDEVIDALKIINKKYQNEKETWLDLGCGSGVLTTVISKKAKYVLGVDGSQLMVKEAKKIPIPSKMFL